MTVKCWNRLLVCCLIKIVIIITTTVPGVSVCRLNRHSSLTVTCLKPGLMSGRRRGSAARCYQVPTRPDPTRRVRKPTDSYFSSSSSLFVRRYGPVISAISRRADASRATGATRRLSSVLPNLLRTDQAGFLSHRLDRDTFHLEKNITHKEKE